MAPKSNLFKSLLQQCWSSLLLFMGMTHASYKQAHKLCHLARKLASWVLEQAAAGCMHGDHAPLFHEFFPDRNALIEIWKSSWVAAIFHLGPGSSAAARSWNWKMPMDLMNWQSWLLQWSQCWRTLWSLAEPLMTHLSSFLGDPGEMASFSNSKSPPKRTPRASLRCWTKEPTLQS